MLLTALGVAAGIASMVVAVVTLILVIRQVDIMERQTTIFERQFKIMAQQDEIFAMERRQRAELALETRVVDQGSEAALVELRAANRGNKTAKDFYWHVSVPEGVAAGLLVLEGGRNVPWERILIGDNPHVHYGAVRSEPLYPSRATTLGRFQVRRATAPESFVITWQMTGEDGMFPREVSGVITVRL